MGGRGLYTGQAERAVSYLVPLHSLLMQGSRSSSSLHTHRPCGGVCTVTATTRIDCFEEHVAEWERRGRAADPMRTLREQHVTNVAVVCVWFSHQILVWHTRTEKPVLVNEGKKGFTDPNVEI